MKLMAVLLATMMQVPVEAEPLWKQMATFGIVGAICAWLLIERWIVSGRERATRQTLADSINENTKATLLLSNKIGDMDRAMWNFVLFGSAKPRAGQEHTPPHIPKPPLSPG